MENNPTVAGGRIVWLDVVRLVAMFTVVCCHCTDPFNFYSGDSTAELDRIRFWERPGVLPSVRAFRFSS